MPLARVQTRGEPRPIVFCDWRGSIPFDRVRIVLRAKGPPCGDDPTQIAMSRAPKTKVRRVQPVINSHATGGRYWYSRDLRRNLGRTRRAPHVAFLRRKCARCGRCGDKQIQGRLVAAVQNIACLCASINCGVPAARPKRPVTGAATARSSAFSVPPFTYGA